MNPPRILWQVAGLALAAIMAVLVICLAVVMATPAAAFPQMRVADAAAVLRGEVVDGLYRETNARPPDGLQSRLLAATLARVLDVPETRIRAAWLETPAVPDARPASQAVTLLAGQEAVVEMREGGFMLLSGTAARLDETTLVPAFVAAARTGDGRWLTVGSREPWLSPWRLRLMLSFLLSAALLAPLVLLVARQLTRPIRRLAEAADRLRLAAGQDPIPVAGPREVRAAAAALNNMRERLAQEAGQRVRILAAVAHDLRNPLTGLRVRAEAAAEPDRGRMIADIDRMTAMISRVLEYVRGRETPIPRVLVDAAALVAAWADDAEGTGRDIELGPLAAGATIRCAPDELRRAFDNLVANALRYGGNADVAVAADGEWVTIIVSDRGPGIAAAELDRLLEPFERLDRSRSGDTGGVGLGLAIARDIAEAHDGELRLEPGEPAGLRAVLRIPAVRDI